MTYLRAIKLRWDQLSSNYELNQKTIAPCSQGVRWDDYDVHSYENNMHVL